MASGKFVSYLRVSTAKQGASGLGLEAQRKAVTDFLNGGNWTLLNEFVEVESGKSADRHQLSQALAECRLTGATLLVAKLDRLSRNAAFLMALRDAQTKFVACDMPQANDFTIGIMALVAQNEREAIGARTKAALAAAKARGTKLGGYRGTKAPDGRLGAASRQAQAQAFAERVLPVATALQSEGRSLRQIASALTERAILTPQGGAWTATAVRRVLARRTT